MKDLDNSKATAAIKVVPISRIDSDTVTVFLRFGADYLKDLPREERERFLQSILAKQGEPNRWLLLLQHQKEYVGFAHVKIDKDERPGWGFVLELYIAPFKRRIGLGGTFFNYVANILRARGVKDAWLLTNSFAEPFWRSLGFRLTGEIDKETGQRIMVKSLKPTAKDF